MKKIILFLTILTIGLSMQSCWFINDGVKTAKKEFAPSEMLRKYEWFKDAAAMLEKKKQDIDVYETNIKYMVAEYNDIPRYEWDRVDKEQFNQWRTELVGVKASYNMLAAEYNSQSSKFNWKYFESEPPIPKEFTILR